jgi:hypothetical protein
MHGSLAYAHVTKTESSQLVLLFLGENFDYFGESLKFINDISFLCISSLRQFAEKFFSASYVVFSIFHNLFSTDI